MGQLGQVSDERRTGGCLFSELESEAEDRPGDQSCSGAWL